MVTMQAKTRIIALLAILALWQQAATQAQTDYVASNPPLLDHALTIPTVPTASVPLDDKELLQQLADRVAELEAEQEEIAKAAEEAAEKEAEKKAEEEKYTPPKKPTWSWTGRIHADYWGYPNESPGIGFFEHPDATSPAFGTDTEDRFAFRRLRLGMNGDVFETMLYKLEVDYNNTGRPEYKDIYLGWKELPNNQTVLLGNQKRPLGMDHLNSSRYNVFMERPLVVEAFNEDARRVGLAAYGYTDDELFHWRYGVYSLENTTADGRFIGDSLQMSANGRLSSSPWYDESSGGRGYLHWAIAGMYARPDGDNFAGDTNANEGRFRTRGENRSDQRWLNTGRIAGISDYEIAALEAALNIGSLQIVSEAQANWSHRDNNTDLFFHGAYVQVSYFLTGEFQPYSRKSGTIGRVKPLQNFFLVDRCKGGRGFGLGAVQIAARYSYLDLSDENIQGGVGSNFTAGLNWFWTAHSKVQVNYIYGDIQEHAAVGGFTDGTYNVIGTRFMVDF
ncbi:MAG: porin [Planctomycetota bacterium]